MSKKLFDVANTVTANDLAEIIEMQCNTIFENPKAAKTMPPLMVWGPPGVGKSSVIKAVADKLGIEFRDYRLSQVEPVDLRGLPVPNKENKSVEWFVTGDFPRDKKSKGIILFDEISAADRSLQVAAYELILDRRLGSLYSLPDGWLIVAAGNRAEDRAVSCTMSSALANRFMHVEMGVNSEDWMDWGRGHGIEPSVLGFIQFKPHMLFSQNEGENLERGWPSPRSWHRVSEVVKICKNEGLLRKMVYGLIGNATGTEFMSFLKLNRKFENVLEYMLDAKKKVEIPEKIDERHAFISAMVYLLWQGKNAEEEKKRIDGFIRIVMELTPDFAQMAMLNARCAGDPVEQNRRVMAIVKHPRFAEWRKAYGATMNKYRG
jgi:hypothetical protein